MRDITLGELNAVAGGNMGDLIVDGVKIINDLFNTTLGSSVGQLFDAIGLGSIHYAADSLGFSIFTTIAALGSYMGGNPDRITYHFNEEWGG